MKISKYLIILLTVSFSVLFANAQKDSSAPATVTIISSYKPVLRSVAKINISGAPLPADTTKNLKPYSIPAQQLIYGYQPIVLKPLAMDVDSLPLTGPRYYVKAGFGNNNTPYLKAAAGFGDGTTYLVNVFGDYISSKGKIENQNYSDVSLKANGSYFFNNHELYGAAKLNRRQFYLYGYDHDLYSFPKDSISHQFNDLSLSFGFRNAVINESGWEYNPMLTVSHFGFKDSLSETGLVFEIPVEKRLSKDFSLKLNASADITNYATKNLMPSDTSFGNNVFSAVPSLSYKNDIFKLDGGVGVFIDNGKMLFMPNIYGELFLAKKNLIIQGGWIGKVDKNTYGNLSLINPYLSVFTTRQNTVETEFYGGIKSSVGKHLQFSAKAGVVSYRDYQFFINDSLTNGKSFILSGEDNVNNLKIHADVSYILRDALTINGGITFNGYTGMQKNKRAWNTIPMEANASLRWKAFKRLLIKSDFYLFAGGHYLEQNNEDLSFNGAADLSLGAEYKINDKFGAFVDLNNIFGKPYERWHNYKVYGVSALGGITIRF